ncbi:MAG TPA: phosphoribosylglycinamide formyltransferase [Syntrophales bacterium]|jgi:phosphoribosylglycinamide formyltransferase-1|nr:phosphoribosylglycinamide formyltransferase [Syntrophales bacterium]HPX56052.1 phosphoribosylglycinamide formyltransferase [Syntrophales bacterium]HQA83186.1 phosphoribosylglycinamide formyltransferase [Syntrophales bacterium]
MEKKLPIGVLASGSGSNLQSIIDHIEQGRLDADIRVVISNNPDAYAITRAQKHGIPFVIVRHQEFPDREAFDRQMAEILISCGVELVVMAGFMRVLSPLFLKTFPQRVINIHPALLPSFPGLHGQRQAFEYGVKFSGCTVHFADDGVDSGPIIIQAVVPVLETDTEDTLAERILREEHRIYPQAIQFYAEGRIEIHNRQVRIRGLKESASQVLHNPPLEGF